MSSKSTKTSTKSKARKGTNQVARAIDDIKERAGDVLTSIKDETKNIISNKIGLGEQLWLSDIRKQQKALFKKLHQETAKTLGIAKWNEKTEVSVDSYTSRIAQELDVQTQAYATKIATAPAHGLISGLKSILNRDSGLVLLRASDGKRIHFLTQPFFSQSITSEDEKNGKVISWSAFKEQEFYPYVKNIELTIRAVNDELSLAKKLKTAHSDLSKEQETAEIKLVDLRKRLESYHFEVAASFWSQTFWNKEYEMDTLSLDKFLALAGGKRSIEELDQILAELKEDNRSQVASSELSLSGPSESDQAAVFHEEPSVVSSLAPLETKDKETKEIKENKKENRMSELDLLEDTDPIVQRYVTEALYYLKSFPKKVAVSVSSFSDVTQAALRKLANSIKSGSIGNKSELEISKFLFLNVPLVFDGEIQKVSQEAQVSQARLNKNSSAESTGIVSDLLAAISRAKKERDEIFGQISAIYRSKIVSAVSSTTVSEFASDLTFPMPLATTAAAFKLETDSIPVATLKSSSKSDPIVAEFSSTLHEPFAQLTGQQSFLFALIALREWQSFNSIRLLERLSAEFLGKLLSDYQPDESLRSIADGLELVKSVGLITASVFKKFSDDPDSKTDKGKAKLKAKSKYFAIDKYHRLETVADLRAATVKNGPSLVTLPVFDASRPDFWRSSEFAEVSKPSGYHTLLLTAFNDLTQTVTVRHSLGKAWGTFGQTKLSFEELFCLVKNGNAHVITVEDNTLNL